MRRVKQAVDIETAKLRALQYLHNLHPTELMKASAVGEKIWPEASFTSQGAGGAGSRILNVLKREGKVEWHSHGYDWGWRITAAGRAALERATA